MGIGTTQTVGNFTIIRNTKREIVVNHKSLYLGGCLVKANFLQPSEIKASVFVSRKANPATVYLGCDGKEALAVLIQWLSDMEREMTN